MSSLFKSPKIATQTIAHTTNNALTEEAIQKLIQKARAQLKEACSDKLQRSGNRAQMTSFFGRKADKALYGIAAEMYAGLNNNQEVPRVVASIYKLYDDYVSDFNNPVPSAVLSAFVNKMPDMLNKLAEEENAAAMHNTLQVGG